MWTEERIKDVMIDFMQHAERVFEMELGDITTIPIEISNRMTTCKGSFNYKIKNKDTHNQYIEPICFKFAKILLTDYEDADIEQTIKHEVVHFIVNTMYNKPQHHNDIFKKCCRVLGISDSTYFDAKPKIKASEEKCPSRENKIRYEATCMTCGKKYTRKQMSQTTIVKWLRSCTCKCGGKLEITDLKEEIHYYISDKRVIKLDLKNNINYVQTIGNGWREIQEYKLTTQMELLLLKEAESLKDYASIDFFAYGEEYEESALDFIWWSLSGSYEFRGEDAHEEEEYEKLRNWLLKAQPFTKAYKDYKLREVC